MTTRFKTNKIFKSLANLFCLLVVGLFLASDGLSAYDFSDARRSLKKDMNLWGAGGSRNKIAIVYNYSDHTNIKRQFNLIKLKKQLSHEMAKSFRVADPVIVQEILNSNNLSYQELFNNPSIFKKFAERVDCSQTLMVDLNLKSNLLAVNMTLLDAGHAPISKVDFELKNEYENNDDFEPIVVEEEPQKSLFGMDFSSPFAEEQTDPWIYFAPTAMISPKQHSLRMSLSFRNISEVDIQPNYIKYDLGFFETIQLGVQSYAVSRELKPGEDRDDAPPRGNIESDRGHHSTYASIKYRVIDTSILPFNVAIGLRGRIAWDEDNIEFNTEKYADPVDKEDAEETDDHNKKLNGLTPQAMVTGEVAPLGLMYNLYVDNQTTAVGAQVFVLPRVRLMGDFIYYFYDDPVVRSDAAFGVQILNKLGVTGLNYQWQASKIQLEMAFNF